MSDPTEYAVWQMVHRRDCPVIRYALAAPHTKVWIQYADRDFARELLTRRGPRGRQIYRPCGRCKPNP